MEQLQLSAGPDTITAEPDCTIGESLEKPGSRVLRTLLKPVKTYPALPKTLPTTFSVLEQKILKPPQKNFQVIPVSYPPKFIGGATIFETSTPNVGGDSR